MPSKNENLSYLNGLHEEGAPDFFENLPEQELAELRAFFDTIIHRKTAGMDKMFEASNTMIKFMPTFLIQTITNRFIEPPIAAKISEQLTVKDTVNLGKSFSIEYVGQVTVYMRTEYACRVMEATEINRAIKTYAHVVRNNKYKALEMAAEFNDVFLRQATRNLSLNDFKTDFKKPEHRAGFERLQELIGNA